MAWIKIPAIKCDFYECDSMLYHVRKHELPNGWKVSTVLDHDRVYCNLHGQSS